MKKLYSFILFAVLSVSAFAGFDSNYYWFYNEVKADPTGKGKIYADVQKEMDIIPAEPTEADYVDATDGKISVQGASYGSVLYLWALPAEGYQFAGWYVSYPDDSSTRVKVADDAVTTVSVLTERVSESEDVEAYGFEPDATYYGVFAKVKLAAASGLSNVAELGISKVANDTGDNITITATPNDEATKFTYWTDSKGNKITENPYTFTVSDMETYTAHFSGDSIITFDFGEGKYIPFSCQFSASLGDVRAYRIAPVEQGFYDDDYNYIQFDETENAWGYTEYEYDDEYNVTGSTFHKYEGEEPSFDTTYQINEFSYNYTAGDGVILYGKGEQSIVIYKDEDPALFDNYLVGTADGAVNIADLPTKDEDDNAITYYVFDGQDFVKATTGTVAQNECYLALDATQSPLPEKILLANDEAVAIESVAAEKPVAPKFIGIYTIDGKQVKAPVKGLNIINGKKVLVK